MKQFNFTITKKDGSEHIVTIDDKHKEEVMQHPWYINPYGYAVRDSRIEGKRKQIRLHNFVYFLEFGNNYPNGVLTLDHLSRTRLDNSVLNLCAATRTMQTLNKDSKVGVSGVRGVFPYRDRWRSQLTIGKKSTHFGLFKTIEEASSVYESKRAELYQKEVAELIKLLPHNESLHAFMLLT